MSKRLDKRVILVALLLAIHCLSRYAVQRAMPLAARNENMYSSDYLASLNIVAGRGCYFSLLPGTPAGKRVREFIWLRRPALTRSELQEYVRDPGASVIHFDPTTYKTNVTVRAEDSPYIGATFYSARVLDLYLTATLWRVFGVRWDVLFGFYLAVSTVSAVLLFLIARKAAGYWGGVVALLLYIASPLEDQWAVRSIRDITPLWFAIAGFAALLCFAGRFRSRPANLASYCAAGFIAMLGCGWRTDSFVIAPILIVVLIGDGVVRRTNVRTITAKAALFCFGVLLCLGLIRLLSPSVRQSPQNGFHVAYYGNAARTDLFGLENSFKIYFCDLNTQFAARYYATANGLRDGAIPYYSPAYASACRAIFERSFSFDAWHWVIDFPSFIYRAFLACQIKDLPVNRDYYAVLAAFPAWLTPLTTIVPILTLLGMFAVCLWARLTTVSASMIFFALFYIVVLFVVLPVFKNSGMLVFPMCVLAAVGVTSVVDHSMRKPHWRSGALILISVATLWLAAAGVSYFWSLNQRARLIADIKRAVVHAGPDMQATVHPQLFSIRRPAGSQPDRAGYLLEIDTGADPGPLSFRQRREGSETRFYESGHKLLPNRRQYFFFTAYQGALYDVRQYTATVVLSGDAQITSAVRADLSDWKNLEVSTVFYDGERIAGSPTIGYASSVTTFGAGKADEDLLFAQDKLEMPNFHTLPVTAFGSDRKLRFGRRVTQEQGPWFVLTNGQDIYVSVRYRLHQGRVDSAIVDAQGRIYSTCLQEDALDSGGMWNEVLHFRADGNTPLRLVLMNETGYPTDADVVDARVVSDSQ